MDLIERPQPRICLLGATFATGNLGVSALTEGSIKTIVHRYPDARIFLLDYGQGSSVQEVKIENRVVCISIVYMRFSKKFWLKNNIALLLLVSVLVRLIPWAKLRKKVVGGYPCLRPVQEADLVASIAGGDSFSDVYGLDRFLYVSLPQLLALFLGKRLVLLPQTLGPFKGWLARAIARVILKRAESIYLRDLAGVRRIKALLGPNGRDGKVRFCYDVGFLVNPVRPPHLDLVGFPSQPPHGSSLVGLNISGLLFMGGYTRNNMFGLKTEYRKLVYSLIDFLIENKNAHVLLVPHVFGEHSESDSLVCERIYEELKTKYSSKLAFVRGRYNQCEIKYIIGRCDFFIGSRMHACIAALSQNIPALAIAYSDKFVGVMETLGIQSLVADARTMDRDQILQAIDQAYGDRVFLQRQLEGKMPKVISIVLSLFNAIGPDAQHDGESENSIGGIDSKRPPPRVNCLDVQKPQ